jgi:hypothetical protein
MLTWRTTKWRYRSLVISVAANSIVAGSVFVFGYFTAWLLIPGAYPVFWLCNALDPGCNGGYESAAWALGWFLNTIIGWGVIWVAGAVSRARRGP